MKKYILKRKIKVEEKYDVLVAGGGPGGTAAAIAAARLGARVLLVEATGCLGGMGTSGLVCCFDPMADGTRMLVGGIMREIVEKMQERGLLGPDEKPEIWSKKFMHWTSFHPEGLKLLLDEMTFESNVEVRFFTHVIDAESDKKNKKVKGAVISNIEGYSFIAAKAFIDATGDAVLSRFSGASCREAGKHTPHIMPATLPSIFCNIDWDKMEKHREEHGSEQNGAEVRRAIKAGHFTQPDPFLVGMSHTGKNMTYLNGGHLFNLNALRCKSLTDGIMLGRKIAREYMEFYRKYIPGCKDIELVTTASILGIRESSRIVGEYELTIEDYKARRKFPDQIGVFNKYIDIHPYDCSEKEYKRHLKEKAGMLRLKPGEYFGIPYRILVPRGWKNLWVAGRCNSSDIYMHGSIRVMPAAGMMGQAAGTAAVQSIRENQNACRLDAEILITSLEKQGAYLP